MAIPYISSLAFANRAAISHLIRPIFTVNGFRDTLKKGGFVTDVRLSWAQHSGDDTLDFLGTGGVTRRVFPNLQGVFIAALDIESPAV